jgi:DNA repair protein RadC
MTLKIEGFIMSVSTLPKPPSNPSENAIIEDALKILANRIKRPDTYITCPNDIKAYLRLKLSEIEHEVFSVIFLDTRHGVVKYEEMFRGTIDGASVYPREVVKAALACNAAAVIFAHNHPSGVSEPSLADQAITRRLKDALAVIVVRVLDHIVVGSKITSFAERGLL